MVFLYLFVTFASQFGANKPTINLDKIEKANNYYKGRFSNKEYMEQPKMDKEKFSTWYFFFKTKCRAGSITPMLGGSVILDGKEKELNRWWK